MEVDLIELATQCPDLMISVKASDLLEELKTERTEPQVPDDEVLLSREETMEKFRISSATIWRWKKNGYLVPVKVGSMDRYRLSDINALLTRKGGAL